MNARTLKIVAYLSAALTAGGCGNVGLVNGVRMNATASPDATYCDLNPTVCILGVVAVVGGGFALFASQRHNSSPAPLPPT